MSERRGYDAVPGVEQYRVEPYRVEAPREVDEDRQARRSGLGRGGPVRLRRAVAEVLVPLTWRNAAARAEYRRRSPGYDHS